MRALVPMLLLLMTLPVHADESVQALLKRGAAHEDAGRLDEAARDYEAARARAEQTGDRDRLVEALVLKGYLQYYRGEMNAALVDLQRAHDLARAAGDAAAQRGTLANIAHVYSDPSVGQYDRAIEYYQQVLQQSEASGAETSIADTLFNIGSTQERKGDLDAALGFYHRALAAEEKLGRTGEVATVQRAIGVILGKLGRNAEALPILEKAQRAYASTGNRDGVMNARQSRGVILRRMGNLPAAIADLEATRVWYANNRNTRFLEKTEEELALAYAAAGRWRDAYDARTRHASVQRELAEKLRDENTSRLRVQFDSEKKEQENRALLRDKAAAERIRRLQTIILVLGGVIIAVLAYLMVRLARDKRRMRVMAMTDDLTRLPNRRHLLAVAEEAIATARASHAPLSLVAFDIDHFKRINDTWGHAAGDIVLQRVANVCRMALRPNDAVGRTGGEEFLAVLPATAERDAIAVAERLRVAVEAIDCREIDASLRVTISLGVAQWREGDSLERLAARADEVLYQAKESGRNRVAAAVA
ncbi:MAG TPA: diguanylate cyclase [Thermoanaerobaculia bacterium]